MATNFGEAQKPRRKKLEGTFTIPQLAKITDSIDEGKAETAEPSHEPKKQEQTVPQALPPQKPEQRKPKPRKTEASVTELTSESITISVKPDLFDRMEKYLKKTKSSRPMFLFDALDETLTEMPNLLQKKTVTAATSDVESLFVRPTSVTRRELNASPKKAFIVKVTPTNKKVILDIKDKMQAPSMNILLTTAIEAYLNIQDQR